MLLIVKEAALGEPGFWILTALAGGRLHGYGIISAVSALSDRQVAIKVTTLYAALDRLEREGLITSDGDQIVDGRFRRYFVLTQVGAGRLDIELQRLAQRAIVARARLDVYTTTPSGAWA